MDPYLTKDISISSSEGKWTISIPFSTMRDCSLFTMEAIVSSGFNTMSVASNPFSGKVSFTEMGMVEGGDRFSVRYLMLCACAYMYVCGHVCMYMCVYVHVCVCVYMCVHVYLCTYVCGHVCMYICVGMCVCVDMCIKVNT